MVFYTTVAKPFLCHTIEWLCVLLFLRIPEFTLDKRLQIPQHHRMFVTQGTNKAALFN